MIRILGFEGVLGDALVAYGAAAVQLPDGTVMNSFTRVRQPLPEFDRSEAVTLFKQAWEFDDDSLAETPLVVVAIKRADSPAFVDELFPDRQRLSGYVKTKREKPYVFILLRDRDAFSSYADETAIQCANAVTRDAWTGPDALGLIRCGLTLRPRDPTLLALRVYLSPHVPGARRTAERLLEAATDDERRTFLTVLNAAENSSVDTLYIVKYEDGDQKLGGFNLNDAVTQFSAIDSLHEKLEPSILRLLPFLEDASAIPRNRLQHFKAASAEIGLGVLGRNLQERIVRFVELDAIARVLRGDIPKDLASDPDFVEDLRQIVNPPGGATLHHRPIGADRLEPVVFDVAQGPDDRLIEETQFRAIGFVQGFFHEVKRAEIRLSTAHTVLVSVSDDGTQLTPIGAEMLQAGRGVFQPAAFALLRRRMQSGRLRWFLQRMSLLNGEAQEVDTIASSIVPKALFAPATRLMVALRGEILRIGQAEVRVYGQTLGAALDWLQVWQEDAATYELNEAVHAASRWFAPPTFGSGQGMTPLMRVVLALGTAQEGARVDQLVQLVNERFGATFRVRQARRVLQAEPTLFVADEEDEDVYRLSDLGLRWCLVLVRYLAAAKT